MLQIHILAASSSSRLWDWRRTPSGSWHVFWRCCWWRYTRQLWTEIPVLSKSPCLWSCAITCWTTKVTKMTNGLNHNPTFWGLIELKCEPCVPWILTWSIPTHLLGDTSLAGYMLGQYCKHKLIGHIQINMSFVETLTCA